MDSSHRRKRLVVCVDGTLMNGVGTNGNLTNVSRFARSLNHVASDETLQVVYYVPGVGSGTSKYQNKIDALTGRGIENIIRMAYSFISHNYNFASGKDEIFLVGFSRGAFAVRCLASLIHDVGLLTKTGLSHLHTLYTWWVKQWEGPHTTLPMEASIPALRRIGLLHRSVKIKACAVWDTVSALGLPTPAGITKKRSEEFGFVNQTIPENIENAFQALALSESRVPFEPEIWSIPPKTILNFKQCWFMGGHPYIGGGCKDQKLPNIALIWMIAQLQRFTDISINSELLMKQMIPQDRLTQADMKSRSGYRRLLEQFDKIKGRNTNKRRGTNVRFEELLRSRSISPYRSKIASKATNSKRGIHALTGEKPRWRGMPRWTRVPPDHPLPQKGQRGPSVISRRFLIEGDTVSDIHKYEVQTMSKVVGDRKYLLGLDSRETIHFTVRAMMAAGYAQSRNMQNARTILTGLKEPRVIWDLRKLVEANDMGYWSTLSYLPATVPEDTASDEELHLLKLWLDRWQKYIDEHTLTPKSTTALQTAAPQNLSKSRKLSLKSLKDRFSSDNDIRRRRAQSDPRALNKSSSFFSILNINRSSDRRLFRKSPSSPYSTIGAFIKPPTPLPTPTTEHMVQMSPGTAKGYFDNYNKRIKYNLMNGLLGVHDILTLSPLELPEIRIPPPRQSLTWEGTNEEEYDEEQTQEQTTIEEEVDEEETSEEDAGEEASSEDARVGELLKEEGEPKSHPALYLIYLSQAKNPTMMVN
ncbi:hypothetical protein BT63DRAFT_480747 [Microthyrium microscopicum]|uniref:T6SS Phospholipase effector Tle1-like catalytic domain-containing protein n=1 Tax=Microthyrium microscopicum TaxID=703497 RepID=A0A6A6U6E9_9PEZI|nr:hypothetical protein BT63DRAFT_480747 [Microthyrium microscopicum]